jgi:hypothetical protein
VFLLCSLLPMLWPPTSLRKLRNDVRFALRFKVGRKQQPLTDTERDMVAAAIVEHIRLCNWRVERGPGVGRVCRVGRRGADLSFVSLSNRPMQSFLLGPLPLLQEEP